MDYDIPTSPPVPDEVAAKDAVLTRRRRGRNLAMLAVLVAIAVLFYAIAMVKIAQTGHVP